MVNLGSTGSAAERWLHRFAVLVVLCTLVLIALGGIVTSKQVGMAVPDWPNTFGYNMFFFPIRLWESGIRDEHVHRLAASSVGLLTVVLAVWIAIVERRSWVKKLGWGALALVIFQGILGGQRVLLNSFPIFGIPGSLFFGVLHAVTAQVFLCLLGFLALVTSRHWREFSTFSKIQANQGKMTWVPIMTGLIVLQLIVAATMRHQHAGLAIPDFPLAYGHWYPPTDAESVIRINQRRVELIDYAPITAFQIHLQMVHRIIALILLTGIWSHSVRMIRQRGWAQRWAWFWSGLILAQVLLGAATIWTNKAADFATAHVVFGAASLLTGVLFSAMIARRRSSIAQDNSCLRSVKFLNPTVAAANDAEGDWHPAR